jgi:aspartyl-tRNA(Asn)/glutamyl-tRNA(Gln) amidotransferase subunit A
MVRRKEASCEEVVRLSLGRLRALDPRIRAFITVLDDSALERARLMDEQIAAGEDPGPLAGVPVALKDNLCVRDIPTTCASKILEGYRPPYTATAVERLLAAGAIPVGKANMDEFAMGSSTENSGFFPTRNPWDLDRVPGGSSGGSAAAVAAGITPIALGSDTGGSIRQPASFCGISGLKPTYGRVSRYGLVAYASSLDQIGPLARSVEDCALVLGAIAGGDPRDSTCANIPVPDYAASLIPDVKGLRVGLPVQLFAQGVEGDVAACVHAAVEVLRCSGAEVREVSLPTLAYSLPIYYILAPAEASSNLARYDGVEYGHRSAGSYDTIGMYMASRDEGFGAEVKQRILIGTYALSAGYYDAYYLKAQKARTLLRQEFARAFEECDVLACPTSPAPAFRIGEKSGDPMQMKLADVLTLPVNIAGIPAISIPCGQIGQLPVGMQLMTRAFDEETLFRTAFAFQEATDYHRQAPSLATAA